MPLPAVVALAVTTEPDALMIVNFTAAFATGDPPDVTRAVNDALGAAPEAVNQDAYAAWMFKLKPAAPSELDSLLDASAYEKLVEADTH